MPTRVYFSRSGREIASRFNGFALVSMGVPSGRVGDSLCFDSITVANQNGDRFDLSEGDFDGAVSVKVWRPGKSMLFGLASESTVSRMELQTA